MGDRFTLDVLNETFTYEVDQILVTLPEETEELYVQNGKDLVTLYTCTPYGVNTHRHPCPRTPGYRTGRMMEKMRRFTKSENGAFSDVN